MRKPLLLALSLLGVFDSFYLWWAYTSSSRPMVCVGGGCDVVRASSYAHFAGLPVPIYGAAMYVLLAVLAFAEPLLAGSMARTSRGILVGVSTAGFLISMYLTSIEAFALHAWCAWCVVSAITISLIFALAVLDSFQPEILRDPGARLAGMQRNLAVLLGAIVLGVPAFVFLTRQNPLPPPHAAPLDTLDARLVRPDTHFYGAPDAKLTVVEFGDFQCPYCGQAEEAAHEVRQKFGDKIRFAFRQFPLPAIHAYAEKAAEASECAARQGKFWQTVDLLYSHQSDLTVPALHRYAAELGLDTALFDRCLDSGEMAGRVGHDREDGHAVGVSSVPTFFIGHTMIEGSIPYPRFAQLINQELGKESATATTPAQGSDGATPKPPGKPKPSQPGSRAVSAPATPSSAAASSASPFGGGGTNVFTKLQASPTSCSEDEAKQKQPTLIHTAEAQKMFADRSRTLFVDVREKQEYASGHIPGALNMPVASFEEQGKTLPKDKTIILYESGRASGDICAASRAAGRILLSQGFDSQRVKVYQDGLAAWEKAGLPVQH